MRVTNQNNLKLNEVRGNLVHTQRNGAETDNYQINSQSSLNYEGALALRNIRLCRTFSFGAKFSENIGDSPYRIEINDLFGPGLYKNATFTVELKKDSGKRALFVNGEKTFESAFKVETGPYTFTSSTTTDGKYPVVTITDKNNKKIAEIVKKDEKLPEIIMEFGKFTPACVIIDKSDPKEKYPLACLIKDGSIIESDCFDLKMDSTGILDKAEQGSVSFGHAYGSAGKSDSEAHDDPETPVLTLAYKPKLIIDSIEEYFRKRLQYNVQDGGQVKNLKEYYQANPTRIPKLISTAGGYGSRIDDLAGLNCVNKPTIRLPAENYRIFHTAVMDAGIRAGLIDRIDKTENVEKKLKFSIEKEKPLGTAGGIVKAIKDRHIRVDRPAIICSGDAFSTMDLSQTLKEFELECRDNEAGSNTCGLMILGQPMPKETIKSFGIMGFDKDKNIIDFIEKPDPKNKAEFARAQAGKIDKDDPDSKYLANIATYILSPELLYILSKIAPDNETYDFGFDFLSLMQKIMNTDKKIQKEDIPIEKGKYSSKEKEQAERERIYSKLIELKLIDKDGTSLGIYPFKESKEDNLIYQIPDTSKPKLKMKASMTKSIDGKEGTWNDIGTTEAYIKEMRQVAELGEEKYLGMPKELLEGIKENVKEGIVFIPEMVNTGVANGANSRILREEKFENFKKAYGISKITGEIIVTEKLPAKQVI